MKHSSDRILTTHCGSLPHPRDLLDMMKAKATGEAYDADAYARRVRTAVAECVRQQVESGIDVVTDGEQSKRGFFPYLSERLAGFEPRPGAPLPQGDFGTEVAAFPEYYQQYFGRAMLGGSVAPIVPMICTSPVSYQGQEALRWDIENLKAAIEDVRPEEVFMPAVAPSGAGGNEYYPLTTRSLQFSIATGISMLTSGRRRSRCTSRQSTMACRVFLQSECASTRATASTKARALMTHR